MDNERWRKIEEVFQTVSEHDPSEREIYLTKFCGDDRELRREVESLLAHEVFDTFIQAPIKGAAQSLSVAAENDLIGARLGPYRVTAFVGSGGMGTVYAAVRDDDQFTQQVAIKIVKRGMDTSFVLNRFHAERRILAGLEHPNIARLFDGGTTVDGRPYFVMEFIEGQPIHEYCATHQLSIPDRVKLFRQVCSAVHYAHQKLVVHRDIKPGNILVNRDGAPKLLDFGIAKLLDPAQTEADPARTATMMRLMTPDYASPEQVRGTAITTATDVYSLGAVLYELLTGQRPHRFQSYTPTEIERIVCEAEVERPSDIVKGMRAEGGRMRGSRFFSHLSSLIPHPSSLRGDLDNIILMAMRKEPERRYSSAEQLSEDLRRHFAGLPVLARQDTLAYRTGKFARRHKLGLAATALVLVSLVGGVAATTREARIARAESARAEVQRARAESHLAEANRQRAEAEAQRSEALLQKAEAQEQRLEAERQRASATAQTAEAERQRATAEAQRAKAENRFQQVRKLANTFLFDFHDKIQNLPGATPARELLVKTAREYLDSLVTEAADDPGLMWELATAYEKVADVQGYPNRGNLGQTAAALESYRRAIEIEEKLLTANPTDEKCLQSLAAIYNKVGFMQMRGGQSAIARQTLQKGLGAVERLLARKPNDPEAFALIAGSYERLGRVDTLAGDIPAALQNGRKNHAFTVRWAAEQPSPRSRSSLGGSHHNLSNQLTGIGDLTAAMDHLHQARAIYQALTSEQPANVQPRRALLAVYALMARISGDSSTLNLGDTAGAIALRRQSVAIAEELAAADPKNMLARNELNYECRILGILLSETNPAEAMELLNKALQGEKSALAPGKELSSGYEANYHADIARPLLKMGDHTGARQHINRAQELLRAIPSTSQNMMGVVGPDLYMAIGDLQSAVGESAAALENYRQALLMLEAQVPAAPFSMHGRSLLAGCYNRLGRHSAALASQANLPVEQKIEYWRSARTWHQKNWQVWNEWTKWGVSSAYDKAKHEQAARDLGQCQAMLEKLGAAAQR